MTELRGQRSRGARRGAKRPRAPPRSSQGHPAPRKATIPNLEARDSECFFQIWQHSSILAFNLRISRDFTDPRRISGIALRTCSFDSIAGLASPALGPFPPLLGTGALSFFPSRKRGVLASGKSRKMSVQNEVDKHENNCMLTFRYFTRDFRVITSISLITEIYPYDEVKLVNPI